MADEKEVAEPKAKRAPLKFELRDGTPLSLKGVEKFFRDIIAHHNGARRYEKHEIVEVDDPNLPLNPGLLKPGPKSPICTKCGLDQMGAKSPYMEYTGPKQPVATILVESIARTEDDRDRLGTKNSAIAWLSAKIIETYNEHGVSLDEIRFVPITRCAWREGKMPNFKTKGGWCRYFGIEDLMKNPPKVVIPVGTPVLGLLSHKSNAEDWSGRLLTWRGWPDDWIMDQDFMLERQHPLFADQTVKGHPLFGPKPDVRIPMVPLQNPRLVARFQNLLLNRRWTKHLVNALKTGKEGVAAPSYDRPWYDLSIDFAHVVEKLKRLIHFASRYEHFIVAYDTETTGLKQWQNFKKVHAQVSVAMDEAKGVLRSEVEISAPPRVVTIMFRWTNPETNQPESIGFPWDYEGSPFTAEQRRELSGLIIEVLCYGEIVGHNLTFDELFGIATIGCQETEHQPFLDGNWNPAWLALQDKINMMCDAAVWDTWHMAFTLLQQRGSFGLEVITYDYVPDLAGYEEEMTLLIGLHGELLNPAARKGGHYANCPKEFWDSHYKPYVMGDVETTYQARDALEAELDKAKTYRIPLAKPERLGEFRYYNVPGRGWVYKNIVSKASRTLTKMMARGMYVDPDELERQENYYPEAVKDAKQSLRDIDPIIERWCVTKLQESEIERQKNPGDELPLWELDLENKEQLKELLFNVLKLKVQRLTKIGRQKFGENEEDWIAAGMTEEERLEFAAVDKYTLNKLAADHKNLGPLQEYRKVFKLYSTYVRPMRNMMAERIDKKQRVKEPNLSIDHCIHASFMLTGTRGGRLCVAGDTSLDIEVSGSKETVEIRDIWQYKGQDVSIKTHTGQWKRIVRLYYKDRERMFEVATLSGCKIKATAGHKILTRRGWVAIGNLTRWDEVRTDRPRHVRSGAEPGVVLQTGYRGEVGFQKDEPLDFEAHRFAELASLSKFEGEVGGTASRSFIRRTARQQKWPEKTVRNYSASGAGEVDPARNTNRSYSQEIWNEPVFSQTEYPGVWVAEIGQCSGEGKSIDGAPAKPDRGNLSWVGHGFCSLFNQQGGVFQESLPGLLLSAGKSLVLEGHVSASVSRAQRTIWRNGGNFLVHEPARAGTVSRTNGTQHTALSRICLQRELQSGFCADWHEYFDRSGRRVSYARSDSGADRRSPATWIQGSSLFNAPGSVRDQDGVIGSEGGFERISRISDIGIEEVWDIEVEDDHSYRAGGLYHHNSCRDPNLQQLPNDGMVKKLFASRFGPRGCIYAADLSQIELRLMAAACGDESMVKAYMDDIDLHSLTASKIYRVPYETFTKPWMKKLQEEGKADQAKKLDLQRRVAKTVNFLTGYGGGAFGLQNVLANSQIYMDIEECEGIIESFFDSYPALKRFLGIYKNFIQDNGKAVSIFGRVRQFDEIWSEDREAISKALRAGCNHLIQSTASDMMLLCLITIEGLMREAGLHSLLVSTVHDSLVVDAVREELPQVHEIVNWTMNHIPDVVEIMLPGFDTSWMIVPFAGDSEVGLNYLETNKIEGVNPDWEKLLQPQKHGK